MEMLKKIDVKDFMNYRYPTNLALSPDGRNAAFAVVTVNEEDNCYDSCLWLYDLEKNCLRQLTGGRRERNFTWLDSDTILFTGNREKEYQEKGKAGEEWTCLYRLNIRGGEAAFLAALPHKVTKVRHQDGGLYCLVHERYCEKEADYEVFDEIPFWNNGVGITNKVRDRLYRYDLNSGEMKSVSPEYGQVEGLWVENGAVLFSCNVFTDKKMPTSALYEYVPGEDRTELLLDQGLYSVTYACRRNGRVEFMGSDMKRFGYNENPDLYILEKGIPRLLAPYDYSTRAAVSSDCRMPGGETQMTCGDRIYATSIVGVDTVLQSFGLDGACETVISTPGNVEMFDIRNGKIYFIGMRNQGLLELYCYENGTETKLTSFGDPILSERQVSPVEHVRFSYKGTDLDGFIIRPVDYDPEKKYPGILTNWIIGHTDRFKAAVPQCSIANWITKTNTTDIGYSFNATQLGGDVWNNYHKMWELSPMKYADRVKTPALIIHCDEDYRCWLAEGIQMFSALKYHGVPAKLFMIHGESHGVSRIGKPRKRVRRLNEIMDWLDRYLK